MMLKIIFISLSLLIFSFSVYSDDLSDAKDAYTRGDYSTAVKLLGELAEQGDVDAQFNLGLMYDKGKGVPQDYKRAVNWYTKAAEQGVAGAQYNLGLMYANGQGVPQDYIKAHMWWNIASASGGEKARTDMDILAGLMTQEQIAEAQEFAREWMEKHQQ